MGPCCGADGVRAGTPPRQPESHLNMPKPGLLGPRSGDATSLLSFYFSCALTRRIDLQIAEAIFSELDKHIFGYRNPSNSLPVTFFLKYQRPIAMTGKGHWHPHFGASRWMCCCRAFQEILYSVSTSKQPLRQVGISLNGNRQHVSDFSVMTISKVRGTAR